MPPVDAYEMNRAVAAVVCKIPGYPLQKLDEFRARHFARRHHKIRVCRPALAARMSGNRHVVRRVGEDQIRLVTTEELGKGLRIQCVSTQQPMLAEPPKVTGTGDRNRRGVDFWKLIDPVWCI